MLRIIVLSLALVVGLGGSAANAQFFVGMLACQATSSAATPKHVQEALSAFNTSGATVSVAFSTSVASGDSVMGFATYDDGATLTGITDDKGDGYTIVSTVDDTFSTQKTSIFELVGTTTGPTTLTYSFTGSEAGISIVQDEFSGVKSLDQSALQVQASVGTGTNAITSGSVTTTANGELVYGATNSVDDSGTTISAGSGFTLISTGGASGTTYATEYEVQTGSGTTAATFTGTETTYYSTGVMTFVPSVASGSGCPGPGSGGGGGGGITCNYYVSTAGNDDNNGTSLSTPFATLAKLQTALEAAPSGSKTGCIRSGTYSETSQITLGSADAGETWSQYVPDGYCTAELNGGGSVYDLFVVGVAGVTFNGLYFTDIEQAGVEPVGANHGGVAAANTVVKNSCFSAFTNSGTNGGPVAVWGTTGVQVLNNVCWNVQAECFNAAITVSGDSWAGFTVEYNYIANADTTTSDMAPIYAWNGLYASGGSAGTITWEYNYVNNYGSSANFNKCLYLDDGVSNATLLGNICVGAGEFAVQVHGGASNLIENNVFDLGNSDDQYAVIWQGDGATTMTGNTAEGNAVINYGTSVQPAWYNNGDVDTAPTIANNVYYNYTGGATANSGSSGYTDSNAILENPEFATGNWAYGLQAGSPLYSSPVNWPAAFPGSPGYSGFTVPSTTFEGTSITAPSYTQ